MKTLTINLTNGNQITVQYEYVHNLNVYTTPEQEDVLAQYYDEIEEAIVQRELAVYSYGGSTTLPVNKLLQYEPYSRGIPGRLYEEAYQVHRQDSEILSFAMPGRIYGGDPLPLDIELGLPTGAKSLPTKVYNKPGRPSHIKNK